MNKNEIIITVLKKDVHTPLDAQDFANAIFVEDASKLYCLSKITLSGQCCREYIVASQYIELHYNRVLLSDKILLILLWEELALVDVEQNKLLRVIKFDCWELLGIYKFKSGYFIHGEDATRYLNGNFEQVWEQGCVDIFDNYKVDQVVDIFDDYWTIIDWDGYKHYYNENGELRTEYCPLYDPDRDKKQV